MDDDDSVRGVFAVSCMVGELDLVVCGILNQIYDNCDMCRNENNY